MAPMKLLFRCDSRSDLEFQVARADLLSQKSIYFEQLFKWSYPKNLVVVQEDVDAEALSLFMNYLQSDCHRLYCEDQPTRIVLTLNYLADKYLCRNLDMDTTSICLGRLHTENILDFCVLTYNSVWNPNFFTSAKQAFLSDASKVLREGYASACPASVLALLFQSDIMNIRSELEIFDFVEDWAKHEESEEEIRSVLQHIRLLTLSAEEFLTTPVKSSLLTHEEKAAFFQYRETGILPEQYALNKSLTPRVLFELTPMTSTDLICNLFPHTQVISDSKFSFNMFVRARSVILKWYNPFQLYCNILGPIEITLAILDEDSFVVASGTVVRESFVACVEVKFEKEVFLFSGCEYKLQVRTRVMDAMKSDTAGCEGIVCSSGVFHVQ